jgi:membrane protease YdiL (CAAX protease family)
MRQPSPAQGGAPAGPGYFRQSQSLALSLVSILPLVVLYHCGIAQAHYPVRNLAEVWLGGPLAAFGLHAAHVLNVALIAAMVAVLAGSKARAPASPLLPVVMVAEAALYAVLLHKGGVAAALALNTTGGTVLFAVGLRAPPSLLLALGAGVYEELLFRLLLVGGMSLALVELLKCDRAFAVGSALVASSLVFAAVHHVGPFGEPFSEYRFAFRVACGLALGGIYVTRGLGVAVWTHAIYNAMAVLSAGG